MAARRAAGQHREALDRRRRDLRDRRRLPAAARHGPRDRRARLPPLPAGAQGGHHPRRLQHAPGARGRRPHRPPGDPLRARVRGGRARRRPAVRRGRRARRDGRRDRAARRAAHELGPRQRRRQPAHDARRRRAPRRLPRLHGAVRARAGLLPLQPCPRSPTSSATGMPATAASDLERAPREHLRELQLERLRGLVARLLDAVPLTRERLHAAGVRSARGRPQPRRPAPAAVLDEVRPARALPLRPAGGAARGARARPRLQRDGRQGDRRRLHPARPRHLDRRDGALPGDGRASGRGMLVHNANGYGLFTGGLGFHQGAERLGATVVPVSGGFTDAPGHAAARPAAPRSSSRTPSYALHIGQALARRTASGPTTSRSRSASSAASRGPRRWARRSRARSGWRP